MKTASLDAMELATMLSPQEARFADLIADLNLKGQSDLRKLIGELEDAGLHVATKRGDNGAGEPVAFIPHRFWKTHQARAQSYADAQ